MAEVAEKISKKAKAICIRPYIPAGATNMGLEQYGMVMFEGANQTEYITCLSSNGVTEYVTGLNENAASVRRLEGDKKAARIKQIRESVAFLEKAMMSNTVDPDIKNEKFWDQVKTIHPNNHEFWKDIYIRLDNGAIHLDPEIPMDLIKIHAIEAGGFDAVAKSYEDAKNATPSPKFYLDKAEATAATNVDPKKLRNKALARLQAIYDKETSRLFHIVKVLDPQSSSYRKTTPPDVLYDVLDSYINSAGPESSKRKAANEFLATDALSTEDLIITALIKDATFYKFVITKPDGMIYHVKSNQMLGRNVADCLEALKNPLHEQTYVELSAEVEKYW